MVIKMYFRQSEHNPPHIHVIYGECVGVIDIRTGEMLEGDLSKRALKWKFSSKMEGGVIVFHRIKDIMSLKKYVLLATFQDGTVKTYDVSSLLEEVEAFNALKDIPHLFEQVKVDVGGYGISWNDEIDLSCDEIWDNGVLLCEDNGEN